MQKTCENCQNIFEAKRKDKRYCSTTCKREAFSKRQQNTEGQPASSEPFANRSEPFVGRSTESIFRDELLAELRKDKADLKAQLAKQNEELNQQKEQLRRQDEELRLKREKDSDEFTPLQREYIESLKSQIEKKDERILALHHSLDKAQDGERELRQLLGREQAALKEANEQKALAQGKLDKGRAAKRRRDNLYRWRKRLKEAKTEARIKQCEEMIRRFGG